MAIGDGFYLTPVAAGAFLAMRRAALADGVTLVVNSAFRDSAAQIKIWKERTDDNGTPLDFSDDTRNANWEKSGPVARPGTSKHEAGTAVDIDTDSGTNAAFAWLTANAARFGFR
jgi:D-alanyl-D-alanine carboxypeptidase